MFKEAIQKSGTFLWTTMYLLNFFFIEQWISTRFFSSENVQGHCFSCTVHNDI